MTVMLDAAIAYAMLGWPVFACEVGGKRPHPRLAPRGFHDATLDKQKIVETWRACPSANIGIACGPVVVLDVDTKPAKGKRGDVELVELIRDHGSIGWTKQAWTPSGGTHFYFVPPAETRIPRSIARFASCIDVLGWGGYVVAPPSELANVGSYVWIDDGAPLAAPSTWVLDRMLRGSSAEPSNVVPIRSIGGRWGRDTMTRAERAISYVERMPAAISGSGGHEALWRVAVALVRGFELPDEMALIIMEDYSSRCSPPWSHRELEHKLAQAKIARVPSGYLLREAR